MIPFKRLLLQFVGLRADPTPGPSSLERYSQAAQKAKLGLVDILLLGINKYGITLIFLGIAGFLFLWFLIKRRHELQAYQVALLIILLLFSGAAGLSLFVNLVTGDPARYANFAIVVVPLLAAGMIYRSMIKTKQGSRIPGRLVALIMALVMVVITTVGVFSVFESPLNGRPNHQYSFAQKAGVAFLLDHAVDDGAKVYAIFPTDAIYSAVLSETNLTAWLNARENWQPVLAPPHFGYSNNIKKTSEFDNPGYLWVTAYDLAYYTIVWPQGGRLTPADFQKLDEDALWNRVFTSGDLTIWRRRSK